MPPKIELLKVRDFGEIISDTFVFVRENIKPLLKCFFVFCGFFIAASALFSILQQLKMYSVITDATTLGPRSLFGTSSPFAKLFNVEYFILLLLLILTYFAMQVTVFSYMALYKEKGNVPPTTEEVWGYFKYFFLKVLGSGIVIGVLLIIACVLCLIPGIYLYPVMALVFPIMIVENTTFSYAFNRSFKLIKDNWWQTFGALVVMILIVYVAAAVVILPVSLFSTVNLLTHLGSGKHVSIPLTIATTLLESLSHVFYILPYITACLCYFSLTEQLDGQGLMGRISQLGNTKPGDNLPEEEF
jgi:uncharacterized membrane protein